MRRLASAVLILLCAMGELRAGPLGCVPLPVGSYRLLAATDANGVQRLTDGAMLPADSGNADWACYLVWKGAGNTALVAAVNKKTSISALAFFANMTQPERVAIQQAVAGSAALGAGLILILAANSVTLTDNVLKAWLDGLVSAGAITQQRETDVLTP